MTLQPDYPRSTDMAFMAARCRAATLGFYRYWESKLAGRRMPSRRDIDPVDMRRWLTGMQLVDVHHNPRRLVYRLVGELDVNFRGYNPTGRTVEECGIGRSLAETLCNYDAVISGRTPLFDWSDYVSQSGFLRSQESLLLPLSDDDDIVNMVATYAEVDVRG
ncbi:MAG: PAS domain-containing protein [Proteobacteria bacterium]|nr:PAS domain-containing protein [Pseudomonadota bacterium]